ncbi:MAG: hypothetical protein IH614_01250 [Desulfuromonadales bacterium]|nr:hypothetical protein [Desulfuromonadales bacterium]
MSGRFGSILATALMLLFPLGALAVDVGPVSINGFISQGYIDSEKNDFLAPNSTNGTFQYNEVGLTFNTQITDRLRMGAQILSRDLGQVGNNEVRLDWGFADYHASDYLGVRLGKVKLPMGLYNEGRDSDFLRPMVFLPQSIYDETKRELLVAYQGAGLYGNIPAGPAGDLDYHGFYGTINFPSDALLIGALEQNGTFTMRSNLGPVLVPAYTPRLGGGAAGQAAARTYVQTLAVTDLDLQNDYITGGALVYNTPLSGLRFGLSFLRVKNDISFTMNKSIDPAIDPNNFNQVFNPVKLEGSLTNKSTLVGSVEYSIGPLVLAAEYSETDRVQKFSGFSGQDATSQSYYGMASYTFLDKWTLSALYDVYYSDKDDKDGDDFVAQAPVGQRQDFFTWRKDLGIGLRYDVNPWWTLKAEYHDIKGAGLFMTVVNDPSKLKENWSYVALKASFIF